MIVTYSGTQEEAAEAYDIAAIKFRGANAVTNFEICIYDVERIMISNNLLSGELARRSKATKQSNGVGEEALEAQNKSEKGSEWKKMGVCESPQRTLKSRNYRNSAVSGALQDLMGIDSVDDSTKRGTHFSNPSSLVTSLSSSGEDSPHKNGPTLLFPDPTMPSNIVSPVATSWFPSAASHLPLFAAWNDT